MHEHSELPDTVRSYYRAVDDDDIATLLDVFDDDAVYLRPGYAPIRGRRELDEFYRRVRVISSGRHHIDSITATDDTAVACGRFIGRSRSGDDLAADFADLFVGGARVRFRRTYFFAPLV